MDDEWYVGEMKEKERANERIRKREILNLKVVNPNNKDFKNLLLDSVLRPLDIG